MFSRGCVDGVLFSLGNARPDKWSAVLFDQGLDQFVDEQSREIGIVVGAADVSDS